MTWLASVAATAVSDVTPAGRVCEDQVPPPSVVAIAAAMPLAAVPTAHPSRTLTNATPFNVAVAAGGAWLPHVVPPSEVAMIAGALPEALFCPPPSRGRRRQTRPTRGCRCRRGSPAAPQLEPSVVA